MSNAAIKNVKIAKKELLKNIFVNKNKITENCRFLEKSIIFLDSGGSYRHFDY